MGEDISKIRIEVDEELKELIPNFLNNRRKEITLIEAEIKNKNFEVLIRIGHSMKGSCGGYGFQVLSELGKSIEAAARRADQPALNKLLAEYRALLERFDIVYV